MIIKKENIMIKFLAKYRHVITAIIVIIMIGAVVFLARKTKNLRMSAYDSQSYSGTAFGTSIKKTLFSDDEQLRSSVSTRIDEILKDLDDRISYRNLESEVAFCNSSYAIDGLTKLSPDILSYLERELEINKETDGAFSPCIYPVTQLWGIEDGKTEIPSESDIEEALEHSDPEDIEIDSDGVIFHNDEMGIDFGAVGKGVAADLVIKELAESNINGAVVSIGGTIAVYGDKGTGKMWHIGIQDPRGDRDDVLGVVDVSGYNVVSTSGDYEKYFEQDGKRYHHIMDPKTGYPADSGLISVTIISPDGFLSDAMSTACFVMGLDNGMRYAKEKNVDAIFVTSDKKIYTTDNIKKKFQIKADGYSFGK